MKNVKLVVTGGRGFIGSHFVELALEEGFDIIDIDKIGYASNKNLPFDNHKNYELIVEDISKIKNLPSCDAIVNFAAESHVDNSINDSYPFIESSVLGVWNLLELVRGKPEYARPLFFHISTDEVYGDIAEGDFEEGDRLSPSNPYSASKACAEMLVKSYSRTYNLDYLITRSSNNYGPRQFEEKLIPKCITSLERNKKIPVHGDGSYVRDWIYVRDNAGAILHLLKSGVKNETYNIGCQNQIKNIDIVNTVIDWFGKGDSSINFVENRWGQDLRYSISNKKLIDTGWQPKYPVGIYKWF
jgi:dTDP-glucose 4,6-dehydratase|tara:strand:- start:5338 stop:6237 length:900 start_codon:yes stop_codon:yes gene_type:complete